MHQCMAPQPCLMYSRAGHMALDTHAFQHSAVLALSRLPPWSGPAWRAWTTALVRAPPCKLACAMLCAMPSFALLKSCRGSGLEYDVLLFYVATAGPYFNPNVL